MIAKQFEIICKYCQSKNNLTKNIEFSNIITSISIKCLDCGTIEEFR